MRSDTPTTVHYRTTKNSTTGRRRPLNEQVIGTSIIHIHQRKIVKKTGYIVHFVAVVVVALCVAVNAKRSECEVSSTTRKIPVLVSTTPSRIRIS